MLRLPEELVRVDVLLDDSAFFAVPVAIWLGGRAAGTWRLPGCLVHTVSAKDGLDHFMAAWRSWRIPLATRCGRMRRPAERGAESEGGAGQGGREGGLHGAPGPRRPSRQDAG